MTIKIKSFLQKEVEISSSLDAIIDHDKFVSKSIDDNLLKTFNLDAIKFSNTIKTQLEIFKSLNVNAINLYNSIPKFLRENYIAEVKEKIFNLLDQVNSNDYLKTYCDQHKLFTQIKPYNCDINAINAFLLLEKSEVLKKNLLAFKDHKTFRYTRTNTTTGRLSVLNFPNILTLPRKYRNIFKTQFEKGKIFYIDFVSLEPRVMRKIGGSDCEIDIYEEIKSNFEIDLDRSVIKQAVIARAYGSSKESLYKKISKEKVDNLFNMLSQYLHIDKCLESAQNNTAENCRLNFFHRPIWNIKVKEENVILNNFIQSSAVDVALTGFTNIVKQFDKNKVKPLFLIHDALMIDVEESYITEFVNISKQGYNCNKLGYFPISIEDLNGTRY